MEQPEGDNLTGQPLETLASLGTEGPSTVLEPRGRSRSPKHVGELNHSSSKNHVDQSAVNLPEVSDRNNGSCVIPGVEHVFFERELEKMEHVAHDGHIVILAADSSAPSEMAFRFFVEHVNRPGYVLHVVHHSNYWGHLESSGGGPSPKHCQDLMVKEDSRVNEVEEKYRKMMADNKVTGEFVVLRGKDAWHDIIQYQESVNGIMIVMGTRGQNSLRRTFMGSVSDSVVHHASCPVLVCCHPKN